MIAEVTYRENQSVYDLCLQVYGTLDLLVKFCTDNDITDMSAALTKKTYTYDTSLVKYQGNNKIFVTALPVTPPPTTTSYMLTESGSFILTENGDKIILE